MRNSEKIILDLCGGTGSWSKPYKQAGYDVRVATLPDFDVRYWRNSWLSTLIFEKKVYGILAAPPCTMFSFARTNAKKPRNLREGMECVRACLDIIWSAMEVEQDTNLRDIPLHFWALENPYFGFLKKFIGKPVFIFDPWEFGDGYQKRTALWGHFNEPMKSPIPMTQDMKRKAKTNSHIHTLGVKFDYLRSKDIHPEHFGKFDRQTRRSITPPQIRSSFLRS